MTDYQPPGTTILTVEVGSTLHGITTSDGVDDLDLVSIVVEDSQYVTGLSRWESHVWRTAEGDNPSRDGDIDHTFHSVRKFLKLACQGNPSLLATLYVPRHKIHHATEHGLSMLNLAPYITSKQSIPKYRGYMRSQALRLVGERGSKRGARTGARPELVEKYGYDTKFAYHMVRLGLQAKEICEVGGLSLPMYGDARAMCQQIREGKLTVNQTLEMAFALDEWLETHTPAAHLRTKPDYAVVNNWLHWVYGEHLYPKDKLDSCSPSQ